MPELSPTMELRCLAQTLANQAERAINFSCALRILAEGASRADSGDLQRALQFMGSIADNEFCDISDNALKLKSLLGLN
ncbi:hypothetical protein [Gloeobacter kilaueensis]|uniref:Uncharacterized protein n=1 Tax=Gloeobacter kilaueensis (strain ATCC BAA-2537 / CCAP 1431/1 / ULC 316 / JS1) TaxID=1183438 RepID=U5QMB8_GLOK1|nr:hypothetical protein [Gloeobacter kilaueensis]AGY60061.1 hypothetical protein GKIL_3815 [Gloeobacter kilaueensis JS1]